MEKTTNKDPQDQSNSAEQVDDTGLTESISTPEPDTPEVAIEARLAAQAERIARLETEIQQQKVAFRDTEVALVTRIADVDDDRRDAATRFQRALQNQREELSERFKRQRILIALLMLLFLLVIGALATLAYFQFEDMRQSLVTDLPASAESSSETPAQAAPADPLTREKLSQLSNTVEEISVSLERLSGSATPTPDTQRSAVDEPVEPKALPDSGQAPVIAEPQAAGPTGTQDQVPSPTAADPTQAQTVAPPTTETGPAVATPQASTTTTGQHIEIGDQPFTVQLMGFSSLDALTKFAKQNALPAELYYQQTTYQGRPWYVLIHSLHETQEAAETTAASIPRGLAKPDIWIRRLDSGQEIQLLHQTTR